MKNLPRTFLTLLLLTTGLALAQTNPVPTSPHTPAVNAVNGETTLQLDVGFGVRAVPPARVTVPAGEALRIVAPDLGSGFTYIWTRNGQALPVASDRTLVLPNIRATDAGTYACLFSQPNALPQSSQLLVLGVGPTDRLSNLSTRGIVTADQALIAGFAVSASGAGKKLILRAVGPSLSRFGVANPLRQPVLRIYDQNGRSYENGYAYPAVVGGPTYESDLADSLARTGAFPLPAGTLDVVIMMPFIPGTYTAQVTSGDGTTGAVLLELYEVP
jgi:hypothetical protein